MLELRNIIKDYSAGADTVHALKGIDLKFRANEFVSILGPSGCGKTTTLNIIGGLDHYTSGDLIINGKSTKDFKDRDWDTYRNHSIGFVFQSYNLIPHQTVLKNVELALTLSGVDKKERKERAVKALQDVGLGDQLNKRPGEMSGGQMQRVAIARALVNDPDIVLLDEPTGALDTETGIMVMEILKEVAKDRLLIMVTHNPELAYKYSTRIVKMLDGKVIDDSMPLTDDEVEREREAEKVKAEAEAQKKIPVMKFTTAFGLSLNNLFTKKGRTLLTGFAGSIGIIGIALIYAVSQGTQNYIDTIQEDALTSYPLSISSETADVSSMLTAMSSIYGGSEEVEDGMIGEVNVISNMFGQIGSNDLKSFKSYLEEHYDEIEDDVTVIKYSYSVTPLIYTHDIFGNMLKANPSEVLTSMMSSTSSIYSSYMSGVFNEMLDDIDNIKESYDVVAGRWPENYDEMIIVLTDKSHITDLLEYAVGLKDGSVLTEMIQQVMSGKVVGVETDDTVQNYTYDQLLGLEFRLINPSDCYSYNQEYEVWEDMTSDSAYMEELYNNSEQLKIVGIVAPGEDSSSASLSSGICYLPSLTLHVMEMAQDSEIVKSQLLDTETDVFSGKLFTELENEEDTDLDFSDMISIDFSKLSSAFKIDIDEEEVTSFVNNYMNKYVDEAAEAIENIPDAAEAEEIFADALAEAAQGEAAYIYSFLQKYSLSSAGLNNFKKAVVLKRSDIAELVSGYISSSAGNEILQRLESEYSLTEGSYEASMSSALAAGINSYITSFSSDYPEVQEKTEQLSEQGITLDDSSALLSEETEEDLIEKITESAVSYAITSSMGAAMTGTQIDTTGTEEVINSMAKELSDILGGSFKVDSGKIASAFSFNMDSDQLMRLMYAYSSTGDTRTYESNLEDLGYCSPDEPNQITVYLKDFEAKENFIAFIEAYNDAAEENGEDEKSISYTDITGVLMSSVKKIVDAITYVLIAFVSISLIVSSIMIGVITLISVQERTKEIGILRAIGASKRNVSSMFNAETVIIGFLSGAIGTGVTYLLCIPINILLHKLTNISYLSAELPVYVAAALIGISTLLTMAAGVIPSGSAAKKDPVVALRTE